MVQAFRKNVIIIAEVVKNCSFNYLVGNVCFLAPIFFSANAPDCLLVGCSTPQQHAGVFQ